MEIIGLDLSLTSTGVAFGDETTTIKSKYKGPSRLVDIRDQVEPLVNMSDLVVIEGYSFHSKGSQAHSIGELGGVIKVMLWEKCVPYVIATPSQRAKFGCGKGNAKKTEVVSAVSARTGIAWESDDECDAFLLQEMGLTRAGKERYDWPVLNRSALEKIDWPGDLFE